MLRHTLTLLLAVAVAGCNLDDPGAGTSGDLTSAECDNYSFDRPRWRELRDPSTRVPEPRATRERRRLTVALVRCRRLENLRRDEVRRLLGEPDDRFEGELLYLVGWEEGPFSVDPGYLVIGFDARGRVDFYDVEQL